MQCAIAFRVKCSRNVRCRSRALYTKRELFRGVEFLLGVCSSPSYKSSFFHISSFYIIHFQNVRLLADDDSALTAWKLSQACKTAVVIIVVEWGTFSGWAGHSLYQQCESETKHRHLLQCYSRRVLVPKQILPHFLRDFSEKLLAVCVHYYA
eukprot:scaffold58098_cov14-Prasinocladus_malaysianus.AAC.1